MINKKLKEKIIPHLKLHLMEEDWNHIDSMFDEVYLTTFDGVERVTITYPEMGDIAMQFSTLNGAFLEITSWSYIKQVGEKL